MAKELTMEDVLHALNLAKIGGKTVCVTPTITTNSVQYSSGDCIGGLITVPAVMTANNGTALLKNILIKDASNQKAALTILLFNQSPTGMTTTNNSAFAYGSGTGFSSEIAKINVLTTDYETVDSKATADLDVMSKAIQANGSMDLYLVVLTTGTPTYGDNSTSLIITFSFLRD